jgi:Flp pilus assembly protein TadG
MRVKLRNGIPLAIRRFARARRGLSAVEFALILPLMLTLFLGGTEITQGITIKRKVTIATRTIGDLVTQDVSITNTELAAIFSATTAVLAPYAPGNLEMVVSSVTIDADGNAKIKWSEATGGATARAANETVTLPDGLNQYPNTTLIWAEAAYDYTPTVGYVVTGTLTLRDHLYLRPRLTSKICRETGAGNPIC